MTAKNINAIDLVSRALAGMRMADEVPTMPREVIAYLAPFAHLSGDHDAVSFLVEAMQAEAEIDASDGWVPVVERLPQTSELTNLSVDVEALGANGSVFADAYCCTNTSSWFYGNWYNVGDANIIAWRPMRGDHD